jgi:hypothetical protein
MLRLPHAIPRILQTIFVLPWNEVLQSVEMGNSLRNMINDGDAEIALFARAIVAGIIANVRERDNRWFTLALGQFGVSDRVLRRYLAHGDSVLLTNSIHITRHIFRSLFGISRELAHAYRLLFCYHFPNLTFKALSQNCSTASVSCGMRLSKKPEAVDLTRHVSISFATFATFTLLYIKIPMQP